MRCWRHEVRLHHITYRQLEVQHMLGTCHSLDAVVFTGNLQGPTSSLRHVDIL